MHKLFVFTLIGFASIVCVACDWAFFGDEVEEVIEEVTEQEIEDLIERHKKIQELRNQPKISNMKIVPLKD